MNWVDYREQLGIGFDDNKKLQMCINRIRNITLELESFYTKENLFWFMNIIGEDYGYYNGKSPTPLRFAMTSVCESYNLKDFISKYIALVNSAKDTCITKDGERFLSQLLETAIEGTLDSYRIPYEIIRDSDGIFIFPKGVPEFDKSLVSDSLLWLSRYPETERAWGKALRAYSSGEEPSEIADKFRKALERFFQNIFNSDKTLENLKSEYGRYLKEHGIPSEIAGNMECLLQQYTNFINNHAKHHDNTSSRVLEYIMYQTGNIIRLLIKLEEEELEDKYKNNIKND